MIEAIIFDFDGVLADSNKVKIEAYYLIFEDIEGSKEIIDTVTEENHKDNRYGIISKVLERLREKGKIHYQDLDTEVQKYAKSYSEITEKGQIEAAEIDGTTEALERLKEKRYRLFIHTATTDDSIMKVLDARGIKDYFEGIYGSSRGNKDEVLQLIIDENGLSPDKMISIGDGNSELEAATRLGITFIALANESNDFAERDNLKYVIYDNLTELLDIVEKISKNE